MSNVCWPIENLDGILKTTTCPCGQSNERLRIVGGAVTSPNQYPFMLLMVRMERLQFLGGATILTERHAVTAAHCTKSLARNAEMGVVPGVHDKSQLTQNSIVPVTKHLEHEEYSSHTIQNDISLLFLAWPLEFGPNVSPICLPTKQVSLDNVDATMIGWGTTGSNQATSKFLKRADVKILSHSECNSLWPRYNPTPGKFKQICTRGKGQGACLGDSGSPVFYLDPEIFRYVLAGVISYGGKECNPDLSTVESDVSYYMPWITSHIKKGYCHKV
ncbi:clotting factor G beta subunit [Halyomorpha halys]|uniref:clotting factor G beta subunit n=1 Tax=Halyomorpha halys TaxID=286706 RepID=UPI0006D4CCC8